MYDLASLIEAAGVLELNLIDASKARLCLSFNDHLALRKRDEGDALLTLHQLSEAGVLGRSFYVVEDSDFVEWFVAEGCGRHEKSHLKHYAIHTLDDVIDVIA